MTTIVNVPFVLCVPFDRMCLLQTVMDVARFLGCEKDLSSHFGFNLLGEVLILASNIALKKGDLATATRLCLTLMDPQGRLVSSSLCLPSFLSLCFCVFRRHLCKTP